MAVWDEADEAESEEGEEQTRETAEEEGAAADTPCHEGPDDEGADGVEAVLAEGEVVGDVACEAGLFEEIGRVVGEGVASEVLRDEEHADDLGAAQVDALEAVEVGGALEQILLELVGVAHHVDGFLGVEGGVGLG